MDVAVVGGGPAGAAAAITLARAGREVALFDKACFPRDKCCGDGLTTGALRLLERLGLDPAAVPSWKAVSDVWVRSPSGREVDFPLPAGPGVYGVVAQRLDLDAALLDVARAEGVKVHEGHGVRAASALAGPGRARLRLDVDGLGVVEPRHVVAADGMWSVMRKSLAAAEPAGYLGEWHAMRQYVSGVTGRAAEELWVWFEPDLLPGYAWSFPLPGGRANLGFGIRRLPGQPTHTMKAVWASLLERPHIRAALGPGAQAESAVKAWPIPGRPSAPLTGADGAVLFAGDAARAPDPMTGEGIGQALETGVLAAESIISGGDYEAAVRSGIGLDNRLADWLSAHALAHRKGARVAVRVAGLTGWTRRNFARWLFEDYPRAVLATPARWGDYSLTGPGAFAHPPTRPTD